MQQHVQHVACGRAPEEVHWLRRGRAPLARQARRWITGWSGRTAGVLVLDKRMMKIHVLLRNTSKRQYLLQLGVYRRKQGCWRCISSVLAVGHRRRFMPPFETLGSHQLHTQHLDMGRAGPTGIYDIPALTDCWRCRAWRQLHTPGA